MQRITRRWFLQVLGKTLRSKLRTPTLPKPSTRAAPLRITTCCSPNKIQPTAKWFATETSAWWANSTPASSILLLKRKKMCWSEKKSNRFQFSQNWIRKRLITTLQNLAKSPFPILLTNTAFSRTTENFSTVARKLSTRRSKSRSPTNPPCCYAIIILTTEPLLIYSIEELAETPALVQFLEKCIWPQNLWTLEVLV